MAAVGCALATLSSSYVGNHRLAARYSRGEAELQQLATQVQRYEQYCQKLGESGTTEPPDFIDGAAGTRISAASAADSRPGLEMLVDESLQYRLDSSLDGHTVPEVVTLPRIVDVMSRSSAVRRITLGIAAVLLIAAFTACNGTITTPTKDRPQRLRPPIARRLSRAASRYHLEQSRGSA